MGSLVQDIRESGLRNLSVSLAIIVIYAIWIGYIIIRLVGYILCQSLRI
jgi:hypothetical protein